MEFLIVLAVLLVVVFVVSGPLRREWQARAAREAGPVDPASAAGSSGGSGVAGAAGAAGAGGSGWAVGDEERRLAELEAAREAKYREIRDADLDHRTGKLSDADYEAVDGALRAEAVEILHELDRLRGGAGDADDMPPGAPRG
jgi:hypothetical protein